MKVRVLSILTAGAMVLGVAGLMAPAASASRAPSAVHHSKGLAHPVSVTKGCNTTADSVNDGILSQNFTDAGFNVYDSQGAADCKYKKKGTFHTIMVPGQYFNGYGPADSEDVIIYKNAGGLPGAVLTSQLGLLGSDSSGTFTITLSPAVKHKKGTFWFSVVANMSFYAGGEWGWDASTVAHGLADQWQNEGGAFGLCPTWCTLNNVDGSSVSWLIAVS